MELIKHAIGLVGNVTRTILGLKSDKQFVPTKESLEELEFLEKKLVDASETVHYVHAKLEKRIEETSAE